MNINEIKLVLKKSLNSEQIYITGDDEKHLQIIVVSKLFENMNNVTRHQTVYHPLTKYISNNIIHAISIKTYTPSEWIVNNK